MTLKTTILSAFAGLMIAGPALAAGSLNIYAWSDSIDPTLIKAFEKQYDVQVNVGSYQSNEDLLTKLQAGSAGYDVVMPSQHFVKIMIDQGLLENIHANQMAAYKDVLTKWRGRWWDPKNDYSIPFALGTAGFAVNRDLYKGPVNSWADFFKPGQALKGKIGSLAEPDEEVGAAELFLKVPFCSDKPQEMKKVLDLFEAQKPFVASYSSDNIANRLGSGQVAMHFWWDGETMKAREAGAHVEYAMPKEGLVGWLDSLVVPKGARNLKNAKAFINFMSETENATTQANFYGHASPLKLDPKTAKYNAKNAPELYPTVPVVFSRACSPKAQDLVTKVWTTLLQ